MNPVVSESVQHRWTPIQDYGESHAALAVPGFGALPRILRGLRAQHQGIYSRFVERLKREWSIETGLIERLYFIDRDVVQVLIEHGIQTALIPSKHGQDPETVVAMISDHEAAVEDVFDFVKSNRPLSTSYIKEIHALMTRHQEAVEVIDSLGQKRSVELRRGDYKRTPNNPLRSEGAIHEYCPPEHVASEMDRLIELHLQHDDVTPEVEAAWLHHRFAQIHPFQDCNGRIAVSWQLWCSLRRAGFRW